MDRVLEEQLLKSIKVKELKKHINNTTPIMSNMLDEIFSQGAAGYHFGNAVEMGKIIESAPGDILCMDNIDPVAEFTHGTPSSMREANAELLAMCGSYKKLVPPPVATFPLTPIGTIFRRSSMP